MKRIYVILFSVALSAAICSCAEKTSDEKAKDHMHKTGADIKDVANDVKEDVKEETHKTTKNGDDAH